MPWTPCAQDCRAARSRGARRGRHSFGPRRLAHFLWARAILARTARLGRVSPSYVWPARPSRRPRSSRIIAGIERAGPQLAGIVNGTHARHDTSTSTPSSPTTRSLGNQSSLFVQIHASRLSLPLRSTSTKRLRSSHVFDLFNGMLARHKSSSSYSRASHRRAHVSLARSPSAGSLGGA